MVAYLIGSINGVSDPAKMEEYRSRVGATMAPYGAKYLAGAPGETVEGAWKPMMVAIIEFPSMDALKQWYECDAYRELRQLRGAAADIDILFVDGV